MFQTNLDFGEDRPPASFAPRVKLGDIWALDQHLLACCDARSHSAIARLWTINQQPAPFMMVTDPTYGVEYDPEWRDHAEGANKWPGQRVNKKLENDDVIDWTEAYKLFPGTVAYVWCSALHVDVIFTSLRSVGLQPRYQIIWNKGVGTFGRGNYHWQHEVCYYCVRKYCSPKWQGDSTQTTVWDIAGLNAAGRKEQRFEHPTQKPVECMTRAIRNHKAEVVYDPFVGSGTTIIACELLNRRCVACEINPTYCELAIARWEQFTGKKAKRVELDEPFSLTG